MDYDVLTQQQLLDAPSDDLLTVIERLRPRWLQTRGQMSFSGSAPVQVILDGLIQPEGIGSLRAIRTNHVEEVHYMDARDATTQYGTDMASGAIIVTTKR